MPSARVIVGVEVLQLFMCLSNHSAVCPTVCLGVSLSTCLSVWLFLPRRPPLCQSLTAFCISWHLLQLIKKPKCENLSGFYVLGPESSNDTVISCFYFSFFNKQKTSMWNKLKHTKKKKQKRINKNYIKKTDNLCAEVLKSYFRFEFNYNIFKKIDNCEIDC